MTSELTARGSATRARIVDAAADLVYARGATGTSLDDVRAASGASKSQLYHYFADREDLLRAVVDRQAQRVLEGQGPVTDTLDALHAWGRAVVAGTAERDCVGGCPLGSLANELADRSEPTRLALAAGFDAWRAHLAAGFVAMRAAGELRSDADPDALALAVLAAVQGGLLLAKTTRSPRALELAVAMAERHVAAYAV